MQFHFSFSLCILGRCFAAYVAGLYQHLSAVSFRARWRPYIHFNLRVYVFLFVYGCRDVIVM
jgi:hypothetical protein